MEESVNFRAVKLGQIVCVPDDSRVPFRVILKTETRVVLERLHPFKEVCGYSSDRFDSMGFVAVPAKNEPDHTALPDHDPVAAQNPRQAADHPAKRESK